MNGKSIAMKLPHRLRTAALFAIKDGESVGLGVCPKSTAEKAVFRIVGDNGKPDYNHPVIAEILEYTAKHRKGVTADGNTLKTL
jgi:hypothetical protein